MIIMGKLERVKYRRKGKESKKYNARMGKGKKSKGRERKSYSRLKYTDCDTHIHVNYSNLLITNRTFWILNSRSLQ